MSFTGAVTSSAGFRATSFNGGTLATPTGAVAATVIGGSGLRADGSTNVASASVERGTA